MGRLGYREFYRRHLPHIQPPGATLFVTFRLAGSLPESAVERLSRVAGFNRRVQEASSGPEERPRRAHTDLERLLGRWDAALDEASAAPSWLGCADVARLVAQALYAGDGCDYDLGAFCIMPNHVHAVFTPLQTREGSYRSLSSIMRSLKGRTARDANVLLGRSGAFWEHENYDHVVRDEAELDRIITYVLGNPVKAGLADRPEEWEWRYCKHRL